MNRSKFLLRPGQRLLPMRDGQHLCVSPLVVIEYYLYVAAAWSSYDMALNARAAG